MTQQVTRSSLVEQAADLLAERIASGEWQLGQRLPGETTLAPQLGVGRSTVREAIRVLAGRGMLQSRQGAGVFVLALDAEADWDSVLRTADIVAVIEARSAIETEAASLAAARRTPADLRAIRRALQHRADSIGDTENYVDADTDFHRRVVIASHNDVLLQLFDSFVPRLRQAMIELLRIRPARQKDTRAASADHDVHGALVDAIALKDTELSGRLSRDHLAELRVALT